MDLKGITWAGNIYQKFEAMCLEVEEVMYADTVKYVENQVEKVGVTVKKFYSEVMQTCVDPVKVAAGDLSLNPYSHTDLSNPKTSILELKKKETKDEDVFDLAAEESSLRVHKDANHLSPPSLRGLVEKSYLNACPTKSKKVGIYKRPIGIKRISQNNHPPKISRTRASLSGDKSCLLVHEMRNSCVVASDNLNVTSSAEFVVRHHPEEGVNGRTTTSDASHKILSAASVIKGKDDCESTTRASDKILSAESDGSQCTSSSHGLTTIPIDNFDMEVIENEEAVEARVGIFEPVEYSKLEDSCILVESDKLHFVSQETQKHKSYKKKIREALSSKLRSTRTQDQFVSQNKDFGGKNSASVVIPTLTMDSDKRILPVHESFESDWELL